MSRVIRGKGKVYIGPVDGEPIGRTDDGIPITATKDSAGPMMPIGWVEEDGIDLQPCPEDDDE